MRVPFKSSQKPLLLEEGTEADCTHSEQVEKQLCWGGGTAVCSLGDCYHNSPSLNAGSLQSKNPLPQTRVLTFALGPHDQPWCHSPT